MLYGASNLIDWQYLGLLYQKDQEDAEGTETGAMWECPSFFPLGEKWVLLISACNTAGPLHTLYFTGDYHENHFVPDGPARRLDHGTEGCFYAPQTFLRESGERVMIGWLREARGPDEMKRAGWSGAMSLPRLLSLGQSGELVSSPLPETALLRGRAEWLEMDGQLSGGETGAQMEVLVRIPPHTPIWSGIHLTTGKDHEPPVRIGFDGPRPELLVDCRAAAGGISTLTWDDANEDELLLRIYLDGSVLEVFVNDRQAVSARFYAPDPHLLRVRLVGEAKAEVWKMG